MQGTAIACYVARFPFRLLDYPLPLLQSVAYFRLHAYIEALKAVVK